MIGYVKSNRSLLLPGDLIWYSSISGSYLVVLKSNGAKIPSVDWRRRTLLQFNLDIQINLPTLLLIYEDGNIATVAGPARAMCLS